MGRIDGHLRRAVEAGKRQIPLRSLHVLDGQTHGFHRNWIAGSALARPAVRWSCSALTEP